MQQLLSCFVSTIRRVMRPSDAFLSNWRGYIQYILVVPHAVALLKIEVRIHDLHMFCVVVRSKQQLAHAGYIRFSVLVIFSTTSGLLSADALCCLALGLLGGVYLFGALRSLPVPYQNFWSLRQGSLAQ